MPPATTDKIINFRIKAFDTKYLLDRLNVYVNDVPLYGSSGINLRDRNINKTEQDIKLELSEGKNKVQVSVLNNKGTESLKESFEINYEGKAANPELYVIAVGVSDYKGHDYDLTYAAKDADDFVDYFHNPTNNFSKINVIKFTDKKAIRENILRAKTHLMKTKVDDQVILFVAGHGLLDNNLNYYFATADIDFKNPAKRGLLYDELENILDGIPARKKLMLIDTCHSGEVDKEDAVLLADNTAINNNINDHFWGRGPVGPDITAISGYFSVHSPS